MSEIEEARRALVGGESMGQILASASPTTISIDSVAAVGRGILTRLEGAGPVLQPLLEDPTVTDVLVNGDQGVWVDRGAGLVPVDAGPLADADEVRRLAVRLAATCGQRLDDASPIVDGTFPSGVRLHAVLPPLGAEGTLISLRTQRSTPMSLLDLREAGTLDFASYAILSAMVACKANVMISGATGSGKTTLLSAVLSSVPTTERIVVIEESAELRPSHPHVIHLQVRRANVQGAGEVSMSELVRAAMRMRPDRLVLGECRGAEVRDVLGALNTGHEGGWATIHANTATDVPARLVALGALAGMNDVTVAAQASAGLDAVIHIRRQDGARFVDHITILAKEGRDLVAIPAAERVDGRMVKRKGWPGLAARLGLT